MIKKSEFYDPENGIFGKETTTTVYDADKHKTYEVKTQYDIYGNVTYVSKREKLWGLF